MGFSEIIDEHQNKILFILTMAGIVGGIIVILRQPHNVNMNTSKHYVNYTTLFFFITFGLVWSMYILIASTILLVHKEYLFSIIMIGILSMLLMIVTGLIQFFKYLAISNGKTQIYIGGVFSGIGIFSLIFFGLLFKYYFLA
jgi:hypothetical protein